MSPCLWWGCKMQQFDFCRGQHIPPYLWSLGIYKLHWSGRSLKFHLPHSGIANSYYRWVDYLCKLWTLRAVYRAKILWGSSVQMFPSCVSRSQVFQIRVHKRPALAEHQNASLAFRLYQVLSLLLAVHCSTGGYKELFIIIRYHRASLTLTLSICLWTALISSFPTAEHQDRIVITCQCCWPCMPHPHTLQIPVSSHLQGCSPLWCVCTSPLVKCPAVGLPSVPGNVCVLHSSQDGALLACWTLSEPSPKPILPPDLSGHF